ncbi:hypothetical protein D3Z39_07700 [Anaerotruncus colihominis]|uniref:Uncharacterized protein n=1 Tax=Anaerotruncus colihominis TaxID=169435 RepID=A0A845RGK4_9FIRM|nr:hypothetical protein [Anaerotruncus colihominis]
MPPDGGRKRQSCLPCGYYTMSAKRHGIIGHWGGSGLRPRIAPAMSRIITALRLLYHVREAAWYNMPLGRQRAAPANRPGHEAYNNRPAVIIPYLCPMHNNQIVNVLRFLHH